MSAYAVYFDGQYIRAQKLAVGYTRDGVDILLGGREWMGVPIADSAEDAVAKARGFGFEAPAGVIFKAEAARPDETDMVHGLTFAAAKIA